MKKIAMILNGVVDNVAMWDGVSAWTPDPQYLLVEITQLPTVDIGFTYSDGAFSPPATNNS